MSPTSTIRNRASKLLLAALLVATCPAAGQEPVFVTIKGGSFELGKRGHGTNPLHKVLIKDFSISTTEITNAQFARFIKATGYRTDAEKLQNGMVFIPGLDEFRWLEDSTANWRFPNGVSRGGIEHKMDHPVTCISYRDALAYCAWAKVRLPTLDEWELACRAGNTSAHFFGEAADSISRYANVWQGVDHKTADSTDGFLYTAPVATFRPNAFGLFDMYGNVFEFCSGTLPTDRSKFIAHARGGSWWCSRHSCSFFNSVDIGRVHQRASFSNQGFRVVKN